MAARPFTDPRALIDIVPIGRLARGALRSSSLLLMAMAPILLSTAAGLAKDDIASELDHFVSKYDCMLIEAFAAISERGTKASSRDRFLIVDIENDPQRFVQCIFHDFDTKLYCEASSGRFGLAHGKDGALVLSQRETSALKALGYEKPHGVQNYSQEIALGFPPDLGSVAKLLLTTMYNVYGAHDGTKMGLRVAKAGKRWVRLERCKPMS